MFYILNGYSIDMFSMPRESKIKEAVLRV
jgi:hypothetical protein